jgi:hypothetical protein
VVPAVQRLRLVAVRGDRALHALRREWARARRGPKRRAAKRAGSRSQESVGLTRRRRAGAATICRRARLSALEGLAIVFCSPPGGQYARARRDLHAMAAWSHFGPLRHDAATEMWPEQSRAPLGSGRQALHAQTRAATPGVRRDRADRGSIPKAAQLARRARRRATPVRSRPLVTPARPRPAGGTRRAGRCPSSARESG